MSTFSRAALIGLLCGLVLACLGCWRGWLGAGPTLAGKMVPAEVATQGAGPGTSPAEAPKGWIDVRIQWPDRDYPGFKAATIPQSTDYIVLRARRSTGTLSGWLSVPRPGTTALSTASLTLPADANYSLEAEAFRGEIQEVAEFGATGSTPVAIATAAGINVAPSQGTKVTLKLAPLFAPAIDSLSANAGAVGDEITITGRNLGPVVGMVPRVRFTASASASSTIEASASVSGEAGSYALEVTVPAGAATGKVTVTSDGITSDSTAIFWVATGLSIDATKSAWDSSPINSRIVLLSTTLQLSFDAAWVFAAGEFGSNYGPPPSPTWVLSNPSVGAVSFANSRFTAAATYQTSTIMGRFGSIESGSLNLSAQDATISLTPATASLPAMGSSTIRFSTVTTFSDGSTNSLVTFSSADTSKVVVSAVGIATQGSSAATQYGVVPITVTLNGDDRRSVRADVTLTNWVVSTLAGSGIQGFADGGAVQSLFNSPYGVARDPSGNLYVADRGNNCIRKMAPDGAVTTVAGSTTAGYSSGSGTSAKFNAPTGVAIDSAGNVYIADSGNHCVRKLSPDGTVTAPAGLCTSSGNAEGAGSAARFNAPTSVAVDGSDNVYVADSGNHRIRRMTADGTVTTWAGSGTSGFADGPGPSAKFSTPTGVAVDGAGVVYVADSGNHMIRKIATDRSVGIFVGSGLAGSTDGSGLGAQFSSPYGLTLDATGTLYVADTGNGRLRKVTSGGEVTTMATGHSSPRGVAVDASGSAYVAASGNHTLRKVTPTGADNLLAGTGSAGFSDGSGVAARFSNPRGVAVDGAGKVYVADTSNHRIRAVASDGSVTTLAGSGAGGFLDGTGTSAKFWYPYGVAIDESGNVFVGDDGNGRIRKISTGAWVTTHNLDFFPAKGVAVDAAGLVYSAGYNAAYWVVGGQNYWLLAGGGSCCPGFTDATGSAARFRDPTGIAAVGATGSFFVADTGNHAIRKITSYNEVTTLAGTGTSGSADGAGASATFTSPKGVAVDGAGNVYVADTGNHRIRRVAPDRTVSTLAGGSYGYSDGIGSVARFNEPSGVAVDAAGNLYVADKVNHRIRKLRPVP